MNTQTQNQTARYWYNWNLSADLLLVRKALKRARDALAKARRAHRGVTQAKDELAEAICQTERALARHKVARLQQTGLRCYYSISQTPNNQWMILRITSPKLNRQLFINLTATRNTPASVIAHYAYEARLPVLTTQRIGWEAMQQRVHARDAAA